MAYLDISSLVVSANRPISEWLMNAIKNNSDYEKSILTNGASAPQDITSKFVSLTGSLTVNNNGSVGGSLSCNNVSTPLWVQGLNYKRDLLTLNEW